MEWNEYMHAFSDALPFVKKEDLMKKKIRFILCPIGEKLSDI